jgi:hypothetical protein
MVCWIWRSSDIEASVVCLDRTQDKMEILETSHTVLYSCESLTHCLEVWGLRLGMDRMDHSAYTSKSEGSRTGSL